MRSKRRSSRRRRDRHRGRGPRRRVGRRRPGLHGTRRRARRAAPRAAGAARPAARAPPDQGRTRHVAVWLFVGVNGVGKTTTIGKLAARPSGRRARHSCSPRPTRSEPRRGPARGLGRAGGATSCAPSGAPIPAPSSSTPSAPRGRAASGWCSPTPQAACTPRSNLIEELKKIRRVADRAPGQVTEVLLCSTRRRGRTAQPGPRVLRSRWGHGHRAHEARRHRAGRRRAGSPARAGSARPAGRGRGAG